MFSFSVFAQTENGPVLVGEVRDRLLGEMMTMVKDLVRKFVRQQEQHRRTTHASKSSTSLNGPFAQLLPGLETGHPVTVGQSPA